VSAQNTSLAAVVDMVAAAFTKLECEKLIIESPNHIMHSEIIDVAQP
jgi:hypothetical protein